MTLIKVAPSRARAATMVEEMVVTLTLTLTAMESPSGIQVDLPRSSICLRCAQCNTQLRHLGGAVPGSRLPRRLCCQASGVISGGGKALGLLAGIAIVALDRACILLDERFRVRADPRPRRGDDNDEDGNDNGCRHIGQRQQATKRVSGMFLVIY